MALGFLRRHPLALAILLGGAVAGVASLADSRIDPAEWHPPDPPAMTGTLEQSRELADVETVVTCEGPEDVAFDDGGRLYTGTEDNFRRPDRRPGRRRHDRRDAGTVRPPRRSATAPTGWRFRRHATRRSTACTPARG